MNLQNQDWYLSFSCWKDEESLAQWRCQPDHNGAQVCGRNQVFHDYRLRVSAAKNKQHLTDKTVRERILLFIGQFDEIQAILSQSPFIRFDSKSYQGVLDAKRGISIIEFSPEHIINEELTHFSSPDPVEQIWFEVVRDYGMFNRAEAPAQFA